MFPVLVAVFSHKLSQGILTKGELVQGGQSYSVFPSSKTSLIKPKMSIEYTEGMVKLCCCKHVIEQHVLDTNAGKQLP